MSHLTPASTHLTPDTQITSPPSLPAGYALHAAEVLCSKYCTSSMLPAALSTRHAHSTKAGTCWQDCRKHKVLTGVYRNPIEKNRRKIRRRMTNSLFSRKLSHVIKSACNSERCQIPPKSVKYQK